MKKSIIVIARELIPLVIAQELSSKSFFICQRRRDAVAGDWGLFSRKCADGLTVVSRDLEYIAIGAKRFGSLSGAVRAAKKMIIDRENEYFGDY